MSQSTNLYQINKDKFGEFSKNNKAYNFNFSDKNSSIFDQNFEGLHFLFSLNFKDQLNESLAKLFNPNDFVGEEIDYDQIDFDDFDNFPESNAIYFLDPKTVAEIDKIVKEIDVDIFLNFYNATIFNSNDIYPSVWHDDESENKAFNKRHLEEGFHQLRKTFAEANRNENYILLFNG